MNLRLWLKGLIGVVLAAFALVAMLVALSWATSPDAVDFEADYTPEEIAEAEEARAIRFSPDDPPVINRAVDYSEGEAGKWWPKGESSILADLVKEGALPPVEERVGSEPCVMLGPDGVGNYGGAWLRLGSSPNDIRGVSSNRLAYLSFVRFSPQGYPIVPHAARSYEVSPDNKSFTFTLRKGMRWSDGHPFTADDIVYWWEQDCLDTNVRGAPPPLMMIRGEPGNIEKIADDKVRISFPHPNGLFLAQLASAAGRDMLNTPKHYLRQFHPTIGDDDAIEHLMTERNLPSRRAVYNEVRHQMNPECPRLFPWVYRTYKSNPPQTFVRNPYYWCVDAEGNQLPYVDRVIFNEKSSGMLGISAAQGGVSMQARHLRYDDYTYFMNRRETGDYEVYHWYAGDRSMYVVHPNLNRRDDPADPDSMKKAALLANAKFRQAISLAIDRESIIKAEYNNQTFAAQAVPGPASFFYDEELYHSFTNLDLDESNRLLDELDLDKRDFEGYRTFPDGSRMTFYLNFCKFTGEGPGQFVVDDWGDVGLRVILRERARSLFERERASLKNDFNAWIGNGEFFPLIQPRHFVPLQGSDYARGYMRWYTRGGMYGAPNTDRAYGCIEPPVGHPLRRAMEVYDLTCAESDPERQRDVFREALQIAAKNVWTVNICSSPPTLGVVANGFRNVPRQAVYSWDFQSPGNFGIETFFFDEPHQSAGAIEQTREAILKPAPMKSTTKQAEVEDDSKGLPVALILRWAFIGIAVLLVLLVGFKHPYIGKRLLIMIPTLIVISGLAFTIIQLPPGSYIETYIMQLEESGDVADLQAIEDIKQMFHTEDPAITRYVRWLGLPWFLSFDSKDTGLLQGNMGRSMESQKPVNQIVGDRILLTFLISLGTIFFTWATAIPIGIYSACRQYSISDYALTLIGFIGMCVPNFLLALLLMYAAESWLGIKVSGLFSSQYGAQPEWDWPKIWDLAKHIWVPVLVLGVGGTAGMIRVMRANLLDELRKPYVVTARAKGVRPMKLLFKYPVRMALNPFISGIGALFPELVSGGAIVAMVLSLPTVGPLMLSALMSEDMYLAGSMLMVLSVLGVLGTLVSDLLLLWLDPRIRFKGGSR